jgi:hypothetical protein
MAEPDLIMVPVALAAEHAVGASVRHALWAIDDEEDLPSTGEDSQVCAFALTNPNYLLYEPLEVVDGPEWCEHAGLPGDEWRTAIVLATDWQGFAAGQSLAQV